MTDMKHLWEIDHPYYCNEGNYFKAGLHTRYDSWEAFATPSEFKGTEILGNILYDFDDDLNFLFRWDWERADPEDYKWELEEDPAYQLPPDRLLLFFMIQRKARNVSAEVKVTEADEPVVREWLAKKAAYVRTMWEPFLDAANV